MLFCTEVGVEFRSAVVSFCDACAEASTSASPRLLSFLFLRNAAAMTLLKDGLSLQAQQILFHDRSHFDSL